MREQRIKKILADLFQPVRLAVQDDSARHAGHAGARPLGETHYNIGLISEKFAGLSRLARHRLVNAALQAEFDSGLHALQLDLKAPEE